jgi:hypothetical protein
MNHWIRVPGETPDTATGIPQARDAPRTKGRGGRAAEQEFCDTAGSGGLRYMVHGHNALSKRLEAINMSPLRGFGQHALTSAAMSWD